MGMNEQDFWAAIPHGRTDPPMLLWDMSKPMPYDFNDPDSQYVMFNRGLEGCFALPFSKPMQMTPGKAFVEGHPLPCTMQKVKMGGFETYWLGVKLGGYLYDYDMSITLEISDFTDTDGNKMIPASIRLCSPTKVKPKDTYASHEKIALSAAQDGIVLLENRNHTLPIREKMTWNVFGSGIYEFRVCAVGAGKIFPRYTVGLLEALREEKDCVLNEALLDFYACGRNRIPDNELLRQAVSLSDTAFMVISRPSGENTDNSSNKGEYYLTEEEENLIAVLREHFEKLIILLNVGYPIGTEFIRKYRVDAVLYHGFGGMFAGKALVDVMLGRVNPSGRLPDTWSERYDGIPASKNFYDCADGKPRIVTDDGEIWLNTVYEEDIYVGYRYFETFPKADRRGYPFGYGLSYTTFEMKCEKCFYTGKSLELIIRVKNIGTSAGREVAMVYLSKPQGKLEQPAKELIAFEKTALLAPGESRQLVLQIPNEHMISYDEKQAAYIMPEGTYQVHLGANARDTKEVGCFEKSTTEVLKQVKNRMCPNMELRRMSVNDASSYPGGSCSGVLEDVHGLIPARKQTEAFSHPILPKTEQKITFDDVKRDASLLPEFVGNMDVDTLARISVCASDGWGVEGRGEAGRLFRPEGLGLPEFIVADGNSGVNLKTRNIGMPSGATLCASFDRELMEQVGRVIGEEAKELGITLILAPALNLHRNPLNGRQPEYFSEDPYLAGTMAGWYCKGLEDTGTGGCYKHLIANNAESARKRNQSVISERAVRELYFRAFEYALEIHQPVSVMTAYNGVNGVFTSCDAQLIQGLLYEECGYQGFVMTDWTSYDSADVAEMAMAGNAWITPGSLDDTYTKQIADAVADGKIPLGQLQDNVMRLISALLKLSHMQSD